MATIRKKVTPVRGTAKKKPAERKPKPARKQHPRERDAEAGTELWIVD
jgi:hypothetical protein